VIDDQSYLVSDGIQEGTGSVIVGNISYTLPSSGLLIGINTNSTIILNFNLNYTLHLVDKIKINSNVIIKKEHDNKWEIRPDITRISSDYSVKFDFPLNWYNISIFKDGSNASSDPNIIKELNSIKILNDTITLNSNWLIKANNIPFNFSISAAKNVFKPAEDFEIEVIAPFLQGIYFFRVLDSSGEEVYNESRLVNSEVEIFSFIIRPDAKSGDWKASIFWYNETDAGVAFFIFKIKISPIFDPFPLILILSIIGASMVSSYSVYKIVKRTRNIRQLKTKIIYDKCVDVLNMDYIILSHKVSSLALFDQKFTQKEIDSSLISGFLDAIRSFGIELTESKDQSQTIKLEYKESTIIMTEYKDFRLIIKMREMPSSSFFEEVRKLSYEIDEKFGRFIEDFKGDVRPFKYVEGLLKKYLFTTFLYPLKIVQRPNVKITNVEKIVINKTSQIMNKYRLDHFFTTYLFEERVYDPREYEIIYSLINKRIFEPVSLSRFNHYN